VANALVHRTWDVNANIRISMFNDRIEIMSPGGLPSGISKEVYLNGKLSILRNPTLGSIFFRLHIIEIFGTGIKRIQYSYQPYELKPSFQIHDNSISVILPTTDRKLSMTTDEAAVFKVLSSGRELSNSEITKGLNWEKSKTLRILNSLLANKYIIVIGNGRGTKYSRNA
jgi:ATP-dependent DNA helicase RecG